VSEGSTPSFKPTWPAVLESARGDAALSRVRDLIRVCETVITGARLICFNSMGTPRKDAEAIVFETLAIRDHSETYLDTVVTPVERAAVLDLLERRVAGPTPLPYLIGEAFLAGRRFTVRPGVFIPRSALGLLLDDLLPALDWSDPPRALEVGCGSGALGISIALRVPGAQFDLVDIDPAAVELSDDNARRHRVEDRVHASVSDLFSTVDPSARYDLIVANLPYVPESQSAGAAGELHAEPTTAIFRPGDGLDLVQSALAEAPLHLADTGTLVLEVGTAQQPHLTELLGGRGRWWTLSGRAAGVVSLSRDELKA